MTTFDLAALTRAVDGGAVAIRSVTRLEPAGGASDKVFPPTYVKEGKALTKYAMETRKLDGRDVQTVLLDSVASQANRHEEALLEGHRRGELGFPLVEVDFSQQPGLEDLETISTLQLRCDGLDVHAAPVADAARGVHRRPPTTACALTPERGSAGRVARATIIASQLPPDRWHDYLADPSVADAICDRVIHGAHRLTLKGPSRRKEPKPQ